MAGSPVDDLDTTVVSDADGRRLRRLRLPPNAEVRLDPQRTWGSHRIQVIAYVNVVEGEASAALDFDGDGGRQGTWAALAGHRMMAHYRRWSELTRPSDSRFAVRLRAGSQGALVDVADYYPILHSPQGYYASPFGLRPEPGRADTP
jgi:hypothetical protein